MARPPRPLSIRCLLVVPVLGLVLAGCRGESAPAPSAVEPAVTGQTVDIPWFEGTVEEAFARAKVERRPVFLYWGAVWCPPCHALRTRLFTRPEFRSRLAATVPVYLDGDTERAQIWGEKLGTEGYPTVIVFDADGREVTRIPSLLPVAEYAEVLSRALDATRPIADVLATAEAEGPAALPPAELNLLAFYAWNQDSLLDLGAERERALFRRLWLETPEQRVDEKTRFLSLYLQALIPGRDEEPPAIDTEERRALLAGVESLLEDGEQRAINFDLLLYAAPETVTLLTVPGPDRDRLVAAWNAAARAAEDDPSLSTDDRLSALHPQLELAELSAGEDAEAAIPAELRDRVRERVRWAADAVRDEDEMQAVMSSMASLLEDAGLVDEAKALLSQKLSETTAPYYYVGWLASLEARAGNDAEAVALYRRAWQEARATATGSSMTPFRWGSRYLVQALRHTPAATETLAADAEAVLGDLLASPDAFSHGNWSRLQGVADALEQWREEDVKTRGPIVDSLGERIHAACDGFPAEGDDSAAARCRSVLAGA